MSVHLSLFGSLCIISHAWLLDPIESLLTRLSLCLWLLSFIIMGCHRRSVGWSILSGFTHSHFVGESWRKSGFGCLYIFFFFSKFSPLLAPLALMKYWILIWNEIPVRILPLQREGRRQGRESKFFFFSIHTSCPINLENSVSESSQESWGSVMLCEQN